MLKILIKIIAYLYIQLALAFDNCTYFQLHVGGEDPAEMYHVATTQAMIEAVVKKEEFNNFIDHFLKNYEMNYNWCEKITK